MIFLKQQKLVDHFEICDSQLSTSGTFVLKNILCIPDQ